MKQKIMQGGSLADSTKEWGEGNGADAGNEGDRTKGNKNAISAKRNNDKDIYGAGRLFDAGLRLKNRT